MARSGGSSHPRFKEYAKKMAALLYKELAEAEMSPYRLAAELSIHRSAIWLVLNAKMLPTPAMLVLIARVLHIPVSRLLPKRIPYKRLR